MIVVSVKVMLLVCYDTFCEVVYLLYVLKLQYYCFCYFVSLYVNDGVSSFFIVI
jgi:hypothetical protein